MSSYCNFPERFKLSKSLGIEFKYSVNGSLVSDDQLKDTVLYNDQEKCATLSRFYCQPLPCDALIRIQHTWCDDSQPVIGFFNDDGLLVYEVFGTPYYEDEQTCTQTDNQLLNQDFTTDLSNWFQFELATPSEFWMWISGTAAITTSMPVASRVLYQPYSFVAGRKYIIRVRYSFSGFNNTFNIYLGKGSSLVLFTLNSETLGPGIYEREVEFTAQDAYTNIAIEAILYSGDGGTINLDYVRLSYETCTSEIAYYEYDFGLLPTDECLCGSCTTIKLYKESDRSYENVVIIDSVSPIPPDCPEFEGDYPVLIYSTTIENCKSYRLEFTYTQSGENTQLIISQNADCSLPIAILTEADVGNPVTVQFVSAGTRIYFFYGDQASCEGGSFSALFIYEIEATIANVQAISEPLCISDQHDCLVKVEYWNDISYDNINFTNGFRNVLYIPAVWRSPTYPDESKRYKDSKGVEHVLSSVLSSKKVLRTEAVPDYMIQKLAMAFSHDYVELDGVKWTREELSIDDQGNFDQHPVEISLIQTVFNYFNRNC